jgi:phosphate transport system substrate-binding protein
MSLSTKFIGLPAGLLAAAFMAGCGGSPASPSATAAADVGSGSLTGAGSTFVEPFFTKAFYLYHQQHPSVSINYQAVGSGAGIQQYTKGTVDFGATDVPMSDTEVAAAGGADSLVEIPDTLGVAAIAYNLAGVSNLKLDGPTLAGIYLGKVKRWNDPTLAALNPGVNLPATNITVVHRSDGSGTSYAFTDYLSKVSRDWSSQVGVGKSVQWPAGIGGSGNQGVGQAVQQNAGAIGYVELAYVIQSKLQSALLKNAAGRFVKPSLDGASAAAAANTRLSPANFSITNQSGDAAYPITTYSWVIVKKAQTDQAKAKALVNLFRWFVTDGQAQGEDLQYAPLPRPAQDYALTQLKLISVNGSPVLK